MRFMSRFKQIIISVSMNEDDNALVYHSKECIDNPSANVPTFLLIFIKAPYYFVKNNYLVRLYPTCYICPRAAVFV